MKFLRPHVALSILTAVTGLCISTAAQGPADAGKVDTSQPFVTASESSIAIRIEGAPGSSFATVLTLDGHVAVMDAVGVLPPTGRVTVNIPVPIGVPGFGVAVLGGHARLVELMVPQLVPPNFCGGISGWVSSGTTQNCPGGGSVTCASTSGCCQTSMNAGCESITSIPSTRVDRPGGLIVGTTYFTVP